MTNDALQDVRGNLELYAKKLAALIIVSSMPQSVKEAWLALLPLMKMPQIARFLDILEAKYVGEKTRKVDESYRGQLAELVQEFEAEDRRRELELVKKIDALI